MGSYITRPLYFLLLVSVIIHAKKKCPLPGSNANHEEYDFIVVGLGTTGAIIASRLSENPNFCVLGLEKGPENLVPNLFAPGNYFIPTPYDFNSPHDPNLWSSPQAGNFGRQQYHGLYEGLGGRTSINGGGGTRPSASILDLYWPSGWRMPDVLPYFKKLEDHYCYYDDPSVTHISPSDCSALHGSGGPIEYNRPQPEYWANPPFFIDEDPDSFQSACRHLGMDVSYDTAVNHSGCILFQFNRKRVANPYAPPLNQTAAQIRADRLNSVWARVSTASAYLTPEVLARPNLVIKLNSDVQQITFTNSHSNPPKATGVIYQKGPDQLEARAKKEIILAGGTFGSPRVLELSGYGNATYLNSLGIDVVYDNPHVGEHFQDSYLISYNYETTVRWPLTSPADQASANPMWFLATGVFSWGAHLKTGLNPVYAAHNISDMQFYLFEGVNIQRMSAGYDVYPGTNSPRVTNTPCISFVVTLQLAESLGSVHIQTADPKHRVLVNQGVNNGFSAYEIAATKYVESFIANLVTNTSWGQRFIVQRIFPEPGVTTEFNMADSAVTGYHETGTCRMGDVVDDELKVIGVTHLRVADYSIFPFNDNANPTYHLFAIGEKISDMIKADW